jgi:hypothetical protein
VKPLNNVIATAYLGPKRKKAAIIGNSQISYARNGKYGAGTEIPETARLSTKLRAVKATTIAIALVLNFILFFISIIAI